MKATALFAIIAALAIVAGAFSSARQQEERDAWRVESDRLLTRIADLERQVDQHSQRPSQRSSDNGDPQELTDAMERLSAIEVEILDHRAELVQLKSDRLVAEERAKSSLDTLRQQVRKATEIETDLGALQSRRLQMRRYISRAEEKIDDLADIISSRQDHASSLDQNIAELALRREALSARLDLAEHEEASRIAALEDLNASKGPGADPTPSGGDIKTVAAKSQPAPSPEKKAIAAAKATADQSARLDQDRSKGLYRFKNLNVEQGAGGPAIASKGEAKVAATADEAANDQIASNHWASKQYELGRALVGRGERNSGTRELNDAVLAFRAVLGEWQKDRDPLRWAATQNDLGYALALLGQRQGDVGVLEQAAIACRGALSEIDGATTPVLWATAQYNLGLSLIGIATIKDDEALWQNAIKALQQSTEAFTKEGADAEADRAARRLQSAYDGLAALKKPS